MWTCLSHSWGDEGMTLLNSCQVIKSLALFGVVWQTTQLIWGSIEQVSSPACPSGGFRYMLSQVPILLNWVKLRPGIWDSGAISSTGWGAICDKTPTWRCLGLALIRGSKQCGMDILPIFQLRLGSSILMWMVSLASLVIWEGSLSIMLKSEMEGNGWWKSLQCLSMAEVVDLECFLDPFTKSPGSFPDVGWVAPICLAFPVVDYVFPLVGGDFVFGMH